MISEKAKQMSELHIAVKLNQPDVVRSILSQNLCNINEIDDNGDQPSHLAARLNNIECIKVLIEFDARMGRKNFCGLTPLGEAQMNGNKEIVALIKENYTTNVPEEYIWHEEVSRDTAAWYDTWDSESQKLVWARLDADGNVEVSATPPPMDIQKVLEAREAFNERKVVRRIHPKSLLSMRQLEYDMQRQKEREKLEMVLKSRAKIVEERTATKIQAIWRAKKAVEAKEQRKREEAASSLIQIHFRYYMSRRKERCATLIQSMIRMATTRLHFISHLRERLWHYRAARVLACNVQRLWRGFLGRAQYRQVYEIRRLPDPDDSRNFDYWKELQAESHPPKREIGIYAEYTLSGTPRTWDERNRMKRDGLFYRDVTFYSNTITKKASWTQPKGFVFKDRNEFYALRVQTFWRARVAKRKIRLFTKAKLLLENAHCDNLENTKPDITSLCNHTLYCHAVLHDYERARGQYSQMLDFMNHRGVDNSFVLYSYAIFGAVTNEEDWEEIKYYARRAREADERSQKRRRTSDDDVIKSSYHIATAAFYLQSVCNEKDPAESWHNYALCQMLVSRDLDGARYSFIQAMSYSPQNKRIISNFNTLLQDEDYMNEQTLSAHEEFLKSTDE